MVAVYSAQRIGGNAVFGVLFSDGANSALSALSGAATLGGLSCTGRMRTDGQSGSVSLKVRVAGAYLDSDLSVKVAGEYVPADALFVKAGGVYVAAV